MTTRPTREGTQCETCAALEQAGRDPALRLTSGSAHLYHLITHHIEVHDTQGVSVPGCEECARWARPRSIAEWLAAYWSRRHYVGHELGVVWDGPGYPMRFADMPPPERHLGLRAVRP